MSAEYNEIFKDSLNYSNNEDNPLYEDMDDKEDLSYNKEGLTYNKEGFHRMEIQTTVRSHQSSYASQCQIIKCLMS
jgi:hypothetical protein